MTEDPSRERCDVAVVGAGAAGLAAAIFAAEEGRARAPGGPLRIALLESAAKIGAKILISGGGRCNVTHESVTADDFAGARAPIRNVLAGFDAAATVDWFRSLGVELKREETGKLFPVTDRARTVVEALVARCRALGVTVCTGRRVESIAAAAGGAFTVRHAGGELAARRVILATGGRSLPRTGSDGFGYELVRALGHTVTPTHPALVPLVLRDGFFHAELRGVAHPAEVSTWVGGKRVDRRAGDLLWTHFGVSGPVVLDASRHWVLARAGSAGVELKVSFRVGRTPERVAEELLALAAARPRLSVGRALAADLPDRLAVVLARFAGVDPATTLARLERGARRALVETLTRLVLPVERSRGFDHAEVTAGGVPLAEIDFRTCESRRVPGLHVVGEILDCDGRIGGFNFQWAWSTGALAGRAAARSLAARASSRPVRPE
jgi:predicted Rossmann fold flavoprotein